MEITEQENGQGSVGKSRHLSISRRDTLVNDLKNSTAEGMVSLGAACASLVITVLAIWFSFKKAGDAGYEVGILAIGAFLMAAMAVIFGVQGKRNRNKIRHAMEKRGIIMGLCVLAVLIALFVRGVILYAG